MAEQKKNKIAIEVDGKDENGEDVRVKLAVRRPSADARSKALMHRNKVYGNAFQNGVMIKQQLETHLRNVDLWDDEKEDDFVRLRDVILDHEMKLAQGGVKLKQARAYALILRAARARVVELLSVRRQIEQQTADAMADQAHFDFQVAACTTHDDGPLEGQPYFTKDGRHYSVDAYLERSEEPDGQAAARAFADLLYGQADKSAEEEFLAKYGFADADGRLIDKQGRFVDAFGRLIDEEGYFINEQGDRVDSEGNRVDASGKYAVEFTPFLEDDEDADDEPAAEVEDEDAEIDAE